MYPHERSLVQKFKSQPFIIVAVNSDPKEDLQAIIKNKTILWPTFFDGGDTFGPIASQWNVKGWPTLYLLDKEGKIRAKPHFDAEDLDEQISKLLKESKPKN